MITFLDDGANPGPLSTMAPITVLELSRFRHEAYLSLQPQRISVKFYLFRPSPIGDLMVNILAKMI